MNILKIIKLSKEYWQKKIPFLKIGVPNPLLVFSGNEELISRAMTSFRFGHVFKTTKAHRHHQTHEYIQQYIKRNEGLVILDIGASDGSTSQNLIDLLGPSFKKYFITDYNIECEYINQGRFTYFFDHSNTCFLIASHKFVIYPHDRWYFNIFFKKIINELSKKNKTKLLLCSPVLVDKAKTNAKIKIMRYNIFEPWLNEKADIIIVGNLLNRSYFSDDEIKQGLKNCYNALAETGIISIIRNELKNNSEIEKSTIFNKDSNNKCFKKMFKINGGVEITDLVLSQQFD